MSQGKQQAIGNVRYDLTFLESPNSAGLYENTRRETKSVRIHQKE